MAAASKEVKMASTRVLFQEFESEFNKQFTVRSSKFCNGGDDGFREGRLQIHDILHTLILELSPIFLLWPMVSKFWVLQRFLHVQLGLWPRLAFKKSHRGRYLTLRTLASKLEESMRSFQHCLPSYESRSLLNFCEV